MDLWELQVTCFQESGTASSSTVSGSLHGSGGRRFSNISNLACSLSGSTTPPSATMKGTGSLELGYMLEDGEVSHPGK